MDYYESAEGIMITRSRAMKELLNHGCQEFDEFLADVGDKEEYEATEVLRWLGY